MAHDILSPGVSVQVIDRTTYATPTAGTVSAAVGFAKKGPIDEPTLILSKESYIETFGEPISDNYYLGMFADKFLDISTGYFTRVAKDAEYESLVGTAAPALDFTGIANPEFWVELSGFPNPNNGIYRVTWAAGSEYADLDALVAAANSALASVTLADGSTTLDSYLTIQADSTNTYVEIAADLYRNVEITAKASDDATNNVIKTTGAGHLGIEDGTSSTDVGNYSYAYVRVPVNETAATAASITATAAMTITDLNQISAFNKINVSIDGTPSNPYKTYEDINITPTSGAPATFATLQANAAPTLSTDWSTINFTITVAGFYDFLAGDGTGDINATHVITPTGYDGLTATISELVTQLNAALAAVSTTAGTLQDYMQFAVYDSDKIQIINGTSSLKNFGSQCSVTVADGTGAIADLGYTTGTNDSTVGEDTTYTASGIASKISTAITEATAESATSIITLTSSRSGSASFIRINTATTSDEDALSIMHFSDGDSDTGTNSSNDGVVNFVAKDAGSYGNQLKVRTYSTVNPVTAMTMYYIEVFEGDDSVEVLGPINWTDDTATNFVTSVVANSDYIAIDFSETIQYPNADTGTAPTSSVPNNSDSGNPEYWQLANGNDGIPSDSAELESLVINALDEYSDKDAYVIDLLLAPGMSGSAVISKLQSVAENRKDIIAIVDPPSFLTYTEIIEWHNGTYSGGSTALTSSHVVLTWGWQRDFDSYNEQYIDLPPSIYEAVAMARTQNNFELWEAPAGAERGIVNSISSYTSPSQAQREYLYNDVDPACVNPIVQFPAQGILIYGQKTCLKLSRATNRINVRRLVNHVSRNVENIARNYVFKLNTASTWADITRDINSFLRNIQERGGLQSFGVVFDATTNTAARIDQGIMYGKVFIQPTRVAERIFIDLTIQETGAAAVEI